MDGSSNQPRTYEIKSKVSNSNYKFRQTRFWFLIAAKRYLELLLAFSWCSTTRKRSIGFYDSKRSIGFLSVFFLFNSRRQPLKRLLFRRFPFTIQRICIGALSFFKICSYIFMIFEVNILPERHDAISAATTFEIDNGMRSYVPPKFCESFSELFSLLLRTC